MRVISYDAEKLIKDIETFLFDNRMSIRELSKASEVDAAMISKFLNKKYLVADKSAIKIIKAINKSFDDYKVDVEVTIKTVCLNNINIENLTIEELDKYIDELVVIKKRKIEERLEAIKNEQLQLKQLLTKVEG